MAAVFDLRWLQFQLKRIQKLQTPQNRGYWRYITIWWSCYIYHRWRWTDIYIYIYLNQQTRNKLNIDSCPCRLKPRSKRKVGNLTLFSLWTEKWTRLLVGRQKRRGCIVISFWRINGYVWLVYVYNRIVSD
jgi:hypothetical protein